MSNLNSRFFYWNKAPTDNTSRKTTVRRLLLWIFSKKAMSVILTKSEKVAMLIREPCE